jgi:hypothetical protein
VLKRDSELKCFLLLGGLVYEKEMLVYFNETPFGDLKMIRLLGMLRMDVRRGLDVLL